MSRSVIVAFRDIFVNKSLLPEPVGSFVVTGAAGLAFTVMRQNDVVTAPASFTNWQ